MEAEEIEGLTWSRKVEMKQNWSEDFFLKNLNWSQ